MPTDDMVATLAHTVSSHTGDVNGVAFSTSSLASCSGDKTVRLWSLDDWTELPCSPLCGHSYSIHSCIFSPNGAILASCSTDGKCILWDAKNGSRLAVLEHKSKSSIRVIKFSPDSTKIATGSDDETLCLWDVASRKLLRCYEGHEASVVSLAYSPDAQYLVTGSINGDLRIWDAKYGHGRSLVFELDGHDLGVICCEISPTYGSAGQPANPNTVQIHFMLASGGYDNQIKLWDILTHSGSPTVQLELRDTLVGHQGPVMGVKFSPNGKLLASCSGDKSVRLWDPLKGVLIHVIEAHSRYVTCCAFSTDSKLLATGSNDKLVKIWNIMNKDDLNESVKFEDVLVDLSDPVAPRKPLEGWTVSDVCRWVAELGMSQYEERFRKNAIDGTELVTLTQESLEKDLGIGALGHRNKILRALQHIQEHPIMQPRNDDGIPDEYLCPITRELMKEPVMASDGYTYESAAISAWLKSGKQMSPMTNAPLTSQDLTPNRSLKMLIQRYIQMHPT